MRSGLWMAMIRTGLFRMTGHTDGKNWRPHILVLSGAPTRRWHLVELANSLTHGRGVVTVSSVLPEGSRSADRIRALESTVRDHLAGRGIQAMVRLVTDFDPFTGGQRLVTTYGIGPLVPNTVILGDSEQPSHRPAYTEMVASFHRAHRNVLIVRDNPELGFGERQRIDVWWGGLQSNGGLMLLGYLLRTSGDWLGADLCVKLVVDSKEGQPGARANLERIIGQLRIGARSEVIAAGGRPFPRILRESSSDADLIFMGIAEPDEHFEESYRRMHAMALGMPTTVFVLASEELDFGNV